MNALTKAFVVVVTILAVVLVALVVPFAARVPDYAQQYREMEQARDAQLAKANETAAQVRADIAAMGDKYEDALDSISALTAELNQVNNKVKDLDARNAQLELTLDRSAAALEIATRENEVKSNNINEQAQLIQDQIAQIAALTSQRGDLSQILIDARAQIRRLSDNFRRIQEENKSLEQQLLEKTASLDAAMKQLIALKPEIEDEPLTTDPPLPIRGTVTQINDDSTTGIVLVQVNVGTRDLVKEGMEFTVSRGDEYIGKIKITTLDTDAAVGQLTLGGGVQEGDAVRAGGR